MRNKDTKGKLKLLLVPPKSLEAVAKVREFGSNKYGSDWGWVGKVDPKDLIEAAERHILKWRKGEILDDESGLPHIHHALTSLAMAAELMVD
jgi:hypothetical protein